MEQCSGKSAGSCGVAAAMTRREYAGIAWLAIGLVAIGGCRSEATAWQDAGASAPASAAPSASSASSAPVASEGADGGDGAAKSAPLMSDAQLGELMKKLSESPGDFPSHNFVSNETSYLDAARVLQDARMRGRAYVGVGPEQNLTYVGLMQPAIAYIVDIRRGNAVEHMVLRSCMERGETRVGFVSALTARRSPESLLAKGEHASVEEIALAFRGVKPEGALRAEGRAAAEATMTKLGWTPTKADRGELAAILGAFEAKGMELAYSMEGSARKYPSLGSLLARREGDAASFLADEETYRRVRALVVGNRLVPVVGDFAGAHALSAVGKDMAERGLTLGVFYTSNVEQYLFEGNLYRKFAANVRAMPRDDASVIVRVWFDQGRKHPKQKEGHRTTTLTASVSRFLERSEAKPYRSFWQVVTEE